MSSGPRADNTAVRDLIVKRWVRYGHDRLYVEAADGTGLGYWDNKAGTAVLTDGADPDAFHAALAAYRGADAPAAAVVVPAQTAPVAVQPSTPTVTPPPLAGPDAQTGPSPEEPEWTDLASRKAGSAARNQALALRQAAPVRTLFARALGVKTDERAWRIGADAEEEVGARLATLGDRWKVLHAVPIGENDSDIDHVVIGPGGVFTVNTKHHPDAAIWVGGNTFLVNGQRVPYIRNSRFEAKRTEKLLTCALGASVSATAIIAVMGARKGFTIKSQPDDGAVVVMTRRKLATWLSSRPHVLTSEQIEAIYAVARRSDSWRRPAPEKRQRTRVARTGLPQGLAPR